MDLHDSKLGDNILNMKYLVGGTKFLSSNLQSLKLNLSRNNLGDNIQNFKYLRDIFK